MYLNGESISLHDHKIIYSPVTTYSCIKSTLHQGAFSFFVIVQDLSLNKVLSLPSTALFANPLSDVLDCSTGLRSAKSVKVVK